MILDALIVFQILLLALRGFWRGMVREVFRFAGWIIGVFAGIQLVPVVAPWVTANLQIPAAISGPLSFVAIFLTVSFTVWLIGSLLAVLIRITLILRPVDKLFGLAIGALEGVALTVIFLAVVATLPPYQPLQDQIKESLIAAKISEHADIFYSVLRDRILGRKKAVPLKTPPPNEIFPRKS